MQSLAPQRPAHLDAAARQRLQRALLAYNRAWAQRGDDGQPALAAARLDLLMLLAQDAQGLDAALMTQLSVDAAEVLDLSEELRATLGSTTEARESDGSAAETGSAASR